CQSIRRLWRISVRWSLLTQTPPGSNLFLSCRSVVVSVVVSVNVPVIGSGPVCRRATSLTCVGAGFGRAVGEFGDELLEVGRHGLDRAIADGVAVAAENVFEHLRLAAEGDGRVDE